MSLVFGVEDDDTPRAALDAASLGVRASNHRPGPGDGAERHDGMPTTKLIP